VKTRAIIADTGPLYAAIDKDDKYHQQSQQQLTQINQQKFVIFIPYPIYLETHKLILQSLGVATALKFSQEIQQQANLINPTPEDYQIATFLIAKFTDQKITLFDAIVAVLANQLKVAVWTYDYHFDVMQIPVWR
jgi:predicted nucleic acid-binding protein